MVGVLRWIYAEFPVMVDGIARRRRRSPDVNGIRRVVIATGRFYPYLVY